MIDDHSPVHDVKTAVVKIVTTWACVVGGLKLADVTAMLGLLSVLLAITYTSLNLYVLWRDKLRRKHEDRQVKTDDPTAP